MKITKVQQKYCKCDFIKYLAPFCEFKTNNGLRKRYKIPNIWFLPNANSCHVHQFKSAQLWEKFKHQQMKNI